MKIGELSSRTVNDYRRSSFVDSVVGFLNNRSVSVFYAKKKTKQKSKDFKLEIEKLNLKFKVVTLEIPYRRNSKR